MYHISRAWKYQDQVPADLVPVEGLPIICRLLLLNVSLHGRERKRDLWSLFLFLKEQQSHHEGPVLTISSKLLPLKGGASLFILGARTSTHESEEDPNIQSLTIAKVTM